MTENKNAHQKPVRRNRVATAVCFAAALITAGVVGSQSATAAVAGHPATAARPFAVAAVASGLGSADLVQSEDLFRQGLNPVGATVALTGREALSACSGEETMRGLTKGTATAYASVTWSFDTDSRLTESAASAPTRTSAALWEKQLVALVQDCQDEPAGHWYYGAAHTLTATGGTARWYPAYSGDGTVSGGVAVLRSGTRVAVVELSGRPGGAPASFEGIAAAALNRLSS
ncbi:hypothetical protein GCM10010222_56900 [Streptomyces tanashiensis]|uniref:hypothetical protein n=1 Tax=Streptomyces tanashiensis TaxID=67367 RepID=UPI0016741B0D|nr:hypothetical protein [Streptomyces tanashiensis]GGT07588.1 hypothetical protein GCM10010222_56900 [Streptomyces tanashiensis]